MFYIIIIIKLFSLLTFRRSVFGCENVFNRVTCQIDSSSRHMIPEKSQDIMILTGNDPNEKKISFNKCFKLGCPNPMPSRFLFGVAHVLTCASPLLLPLLITIATLIRRYDIRPIHPPRKFQGFDSGIPG